MHIEESKVLVRELEEFNSQIQDAFGQKINEESEVLLQLINKLNTQINLAQSRADDIIKDVEKLDYDIMFG